MVSLRIHAAAGCALLGFCFLSACTHFSRSEAETLFAQFSGIESISAESKQNLEFDLSEKYGIYRAVVPITADEAKTIRAKDQSREWRTGPVPVSIWKSTIMMGADRTIPERFIPVYTNDLLYAYSEQGVHSRVYVLDLTRQSRPVLYFVSTDLR